MAKRKNKKKDDRTNKMPRLEVESYVWAMIIRLLPAKCLFGLQRICRTFRILVHTSSVWSDYFGIHNIEFTSEEFRKAVLKSPRACFMYTRTFIASDVLREFLNVECCTDREFPVFYFNDITQNAIFLPSFLERRIKTIDPVYKDIVITSSISEELRQKYPKDTLHYPELLYRRWDLDFHTGNRNLSQTKEWIEEFCFMEKTTKTTSWNIRFKMGKYLETIPLVNNRHSSEVIMGEIDLDTFWSLVCFRLSPSGSAQCCAVLGNMKELFLNLFTFFRINANDGIPENEHIDYIKLCLEVLIEKYKALY